MPSCPFCEIDKAHIIWSNELAIAFRDRYPVSPGHTLVITRRHVATYFDATPWEKQALWQGVEAVQAQLDGAGPPDGYNVGFNAGEAAGQTVMHLHLHVIPRYHGDMPDPRGGIRGAIPSKQQYDPGPPESRSVFADLPRFIPGEDHHFLPVLRAAIDRASHIDIAAAFVQPSGLAPVEGHLTDALNRGAQVRILTGDYMNITHPHALQALLTWTTKFPALQARLYRVTPGKSFHPKAYIFRKGAHGVAFVGSSNLSKTALTTGVEWNLQTSQADATTFAAIGKRFEQIFHSDAAQDLTAELVASYQQRVPVTAAPEPVAAKPKAREIQVEVLRQLALSREAGERRGLVVMATGLGKTFLSAFDFDQLEGRRALFVAHREEILTQAAATWRLVHPHRSIGYLRAGEHQPDADLVFASVQTLSRAEHLRTFPADHFDYLVIDEFHHAAAASYRKLLAHFSPRFMLGLTATPNRMDGAALLELCDDNLVARIGLVEGIHRGDLVPFHYYGVKDTLDYETIPWRSGRFDTHALTEQAATQGRAEQALQAYRRHAPASHRRALVFCCSTRHADFMAAYLTQHGVNAAAVHSGTTSAPRAASLERLRTGELEALVAVDVFNEGVDLPDVNVILMLRPTESPIIFLQQLGRGLRTGKKHAKPHLVVVDFIGNHRSFLVKPQALVALTGVDIPPGAALLRLRKGLADHLPEGCSVHIDTEILDMLEKVARLSTDDHLLYIFLQLRDSHARRPTAREVFAAGVNMNPIKKRYGTWFDFLAAQGDLTEHEDRVLQTHRDWFVDLGKTQMSRAYKMVCLEALADADALHRDIDVTQLADRCWTRMRTDLLLRAEVAEHEASGADLTEFTKRWRKMPLQIFHAAKGFSRQWFALDGEKFVSRLRVSPDDRPVFDAMTSELVSLRMAQYIDRKRRVAQVLPKNAPIELLVSHTRGRPILRFDRTRRPDIPEGDVAVWVEGQTVQLRFVKIAVNVATETPGGPNILPRLMRTWFGPTAGQPGTRHRVELFADTLGRWQIRKPLGAQEQDPIALHAVPYFPELAVACGYTEAQFEGHDTLASLSIRSNRTLDAKRHFVVRASGNSMDGGTMPIADGALVLCEWASVTDPHQVAGKPVLLTGGTGDEVLATLKIPVLIDGKWHLRSTNPRFPDQELSPGVNFRVAGRVLEVVEERTGLIQWGLYDRTALAAAFGFENNPSWRTGHRDVTVQGQPHSILMVNLRKPDGAPIEHRYADQFLSPDSFQWESQATTGPTGAKGKRILGHLHEGRQIHLFVRYHTRDANQKGEPFVYCGRLRIQRHEGAKPIRVWFALERPLPQRLFKIWSGLA